MHIKGLHKNIYRLYAYSRTQECLDVYRQKYQKRVNTWEKLTAEGVNLKLKQEFSDISRSTYYRHKAILKNLEKGILPPSKRPLRLNKPKWGEADMQLVLRLRRENPTYGKEKIAVILKRDLGETLSQSTVGRILKHLMHKGLIQKSPSALRVKRKRTFEKHAKPWKYKDYKAMQMGERIQIDHMTVTKNGITLIVLPPAKPQYNGGVERGNRIFREEFYNSTDLLEDSVRGMQAALSKAVGKYNTYRPHRNLNGLTPMQYLQLNHPETFIQS